VRTLESRRSGGGPRFAAPGDAEERPLVDVPGFARSLTELIDRARRREIEVVVRTISREQGAMWLAV